MKTKLNSLTYGTLTPWGIDVLPLLARGDANKGIAAQLAPTKESGKGSLRHILARLGASMLGYLGAGLP